jgi:hypothetical protein
MKSNKAVSNAEQSSSGFRFRSSGYLILLVLKVNIAFPFIRCLLEALLNALFLGSSHDMVNAQNLNLDVLELVFAHLATGNDLAAVALVSRSFLAGVIPRLYETLLFRLSQAKRYPSVSSRLIRLPQVAFNALTLSQKVTAPFAAILKHPGLAKHVRNIGEPSFWREFFIISDILA